MPFVDEQGHEQPDINDPNDGNMHGSSNPHTEPVPEVVDNNVEEVQQEEETKPEKVEVEVKKSSKK